MPKPQLSKPYISLGFEFSTMVPIMLKEASESIKTEKIASIIYFKYCYKSKKRYTKRALKRQINNFVLQSSEKACFATKRNFLMTINDFSSEIEFKTSRSGGKGGQNVNKVETKVNARWLVATSSYFNKEQKERILLKMKLQINKDGYLLMQSSDTRSQLENKQLVVQKMLLLVHKALLLQSPRKATKTPKSIVQKRLDSKRMHARKKENRQGRDFE